MPRADIIFKTAHLLTVSAAVFVVFITGLLYPTRCRAQITAAAREFGLEPELVFAVVATESGFDSRAVSRAGACGLMQLMPDTFSFAAGRVGGLTDIFDVRSNLRAGCWYLKYLLGRFPKRHALAAYNAGEGRVREWIDAGLEEYPFPETELYVKRVERAVSVYRYKL